MPHKSWAIKGLTQVQRTLFVSVKFSMFNYNYSMGNYSCDIITENILWNIIKRISYLNSCRLRYTRELTGVSVLKTFHCFDEGSTVVRSQYATSKWVLAFEFFDLSLELAPFNIKLRYSVCRSGVRSKYLDIDSGLCRNETVLPFITDAFKYF